MTTLPERNLDSWRQNFRCFAAVIRSDTAVRRAFEGQGLLAWWWRLVLALHGRPTQTKFPPAYRCRCVADGFRFYGWLYRGLAIILGLTAVGCCVWDLAAFFWVLWLAASAAYLWIIGGLAFTGAMQYERSTGSAVWHLVAFLFFISIFLAGGLIALGQQVWLNGWLPDAVNFSLTLGVLTFGLGSYVIELAVLVVRAPIQKGRLT
jgi:hypothetical protein